MNDNQRKALLNMVDYPLAPKAFRDRKTGLIKMIGADLTQKEASLLFKLVHSVKAWDRNPMPYNERFLSVYEGEIKQLDELINKYA